MSPLFISTSIHTDDALATVVPRLSVRVLNNEPRYDLSRATIKMTDKRMCREIVLRTVATIRP